MRSVSLEGGADGSIEAAVPAGALVWLMESDPAAVLAASAAACREAIDGLGADETPEALVLLGCSARSKFLRSDAPEEIARVTDLAGDATIAGLYANGEIARTRGVMGFHHQTLVVLALA